MMRDWGWGLGSRSQHEHLGIGKGTYEGFGQGRSVFRLFNLESRATAMNRGKCAVGVGSGLHEIHPTRKYWLSLGIWAGELWTRGQNIHCGRLASQLCCGNCPKRVMRRLISSAYAPRIAVMPEVDGMNLMNHCPPCRCCLCFCSCPVG